MKTEMYIAASRGRNLQDRNEGGVWTQVLERRYDGCSNTLTNTEKDNYLVTTKEDNMNEMKKKRPEGKGWCWDEEKQKWFRVRKLTPRECFRLMDVKEEDIDKLMAKDESGKQIISNSQLYKCAGNSIVVAPMALTFLNIFAEDKDKSYKSGEQLTLF